MKNWQQTTVADKNIKIKLIVTYRGERVQLFGTFRRFLPTLRKNKISKFKVLGFWLIISQELVQFPRLEMLFVSKITKWQFSRSVWLLLSWFFWPTSENDFTWWLQSSMIIFVTESFNLNVPNFFVRWRHHSSLIVQLWCKEHNRIDLKLILAESFIRPS